MKEIITKKHSGGRRKLPDNMKRQTVTVTIDATVKRQLERDIEDGKIRSISSLLHDLIVNYYKKGSVID